MKKQTNGWTAVEDALPPCLHTNSRTGHTCSAWLLVAIDNELEDGLFYMRKSDQAWFSEHSSFSIHGITHWMPLPKNPKQSIKKSL